MPIFWPASNFYHVISEYLIKSLTNLSNCEIIKKIVLRNVTWEVDKYLNFVERKKYNLGR